jgi:nucleoside diphosphate kinase
VARCLIAEIISRFERKGLKLVAMQFLLPSVDLLQTFYAAYSSQPWYPALIAYMSSGPVVAMVWEGLNAVAIGVTLSGAERPWQAAPGTIRGDFAIEVSRRCGSCSPHPVGIFVESSPAAPRPTNWPSHPPAAAGALLAVHCRPAATSSTPRRT